MRKVLRKEKVLMSSHFTAKRKKIQKTKIEQNLSSKMMNMERNPFSRNNGNKK